MKLLVTGAAGFVGHALVDSLCRRGDEVIGVDNLNSYYDVSLKRARLAQLEQYDNFRFQHLDIADSAALQELFAVESFERVLNMAAQAGVRYSLENPAAYVNSNLVGFANLLECCRQHHIEHFLYASSSSVYGSNREMPLSTSQNVDHPISFYAATKKSNELMAHSYSHLFQLATTGLRFFTVYGPWGRPDMSPILFADAITQGRPIKVFNHGHHKRDFTYIDDIVAGVLLCLDRPPQADPDWSGFDTDPSRSSAPWRVYNIGRGEPVGLLNYIDLMEKALGKTTQHEMLPGQPGDVGETYADIESLVQDTGYAPRVSLEEGIGYFADWYRGYYRAK